MLVHRRARRRGLGAALMRAAESFAREAGRSLLVLDTASPEAERLYARLGWQLCGVIPRYALMPTGEPCATSYFYRDLGHRLRRAGSVAGAGAAVRQTVG